MSVDSTTRNGKLDFEIKVNGFKIVADVSEKNGGSNLGPNPHDLLEAALAACTAITMQMYANRKGYPLKSSDVKINITKEGAENEITRDITLEGDLTGEQRTAILEIADKCPIHRFLERGAKIVTSGR
ncbi:MAG: OsmC family protein [Bdellovibrionaceae bacterium]|nr:OsmC family protein [Pseudobdellovibrionaceae bacterium]